jgi:CubicO group peptidase (beta-lactamase class C family)
MDNLNPRKITKAVRYIDLWLDTNFSNSEFPGMQVAIQHKDEIVYSSAFGFTDLERQTKMSPKNTFRVASHSKTYTATAIMQLYEAGKLNLDDKICKYLDWFKSSHDERVANVTIRQLLNHTSGITRDGADSDYWQLLREFPSKDELKEYISTSKLIYDGDDVYKYSNYGYGYLGFVIESVSGVSYRDYMTNNIIDKLNLESTWPDLDTSNRDILAKGYSRGLSGRKRKQYDNVDARALSPAAGFCSNAVDLCKFFASHFYNNDVLLSDYSKRYMQHGNWESKSGECYGFGMDEIKLKNRKIGGHGGGFPGFRTNTRFDPKKKIVVSVLINSDSVNPRDICNSLINIIDSFQQAGDDIEIDTDTVSRFEGRFYTAEHEILDIVAIGKKLFAIEPLWWSEFNKAKELVVKNDCTLIIEKAGGFSPVGEDISYYFCDNGDVSSIKVAGLTMLPYAEAAKLGWAE